MCVCVCVCVKLSLRDLNPDHRSPHPTSIYTYKLTIAHHSTMVILYDFKL